MKRIFTKCLLLILVASVWACDRQATQEVVVYTSVNGEIKAGREREGNQKTTGAQRLKGVYCQDYWGRQSNPLQFHWFKKPHHIISILWRRICGS